MAARHVPDCPNQGPKPANGSLGCTAARWRPRRVVSGRPHQRRPLLAVAVGSTHRRGCRTAAKGGDARRRDHHRFVRASDFKKVRDVSDPDVWRSRAESDLFRSKRCLALADLLRARAALDQFLYPKPSRDGLGQALDDAKGKRAIAMVLRRAKAESVGTEIADLTVCGAVAPYNALLGGKLVSMLAVSPSVVRAYHRRYADYSSEIASSMAGRPIRRRTNLVI